MLLKKDVIIIGIAGGSASGKTSIACCVKKSFGNNKSVAIIREDDYYKDQSSLSFEERLKTNYDHPFAFDHDLLIKHLLTLKNRVVIEKPTYDFVKHTRSNITESVEPADVIIVEGLFVLENEKIRNYLDMKIFVDTEADIRFIRRLQRDLIQRGRTLDSVINQYVNTVRIMHERFIEPSKRYADIIIPQGAENKVAIDLLKTKISSILALKK